MVKDNIEDKIDEFQKIMIHNQKVLMNKIIETQIMIKDLVWVTHREKYEGNENDRE